MSQYRVQNPVTDTVLETFETLEDAAVDPIIAASSDAFDEWSATPVAKRAEIVAKAAALFEERKDKLLSLIHI